MFRFALMLLAIVGALAGTTKETMTEGDGKSFCTKGQKVEVHYTGSLADGGRKFDSSRDRGEPIQFVLGRGKVIRGWDQGLKMMCLGEHGILHVPSYKGYGTSGAPPAIPPNADLEFDVELLAINDETAPGFKFPQPPKHSSAS